MKPDRKIYQKYHFQINKIDSLLKEKENELKTTFEKREQNMKDLIETKAQLSTTYKIHDDLKKQIEQINKEITNTLSEINRIKPTLKYKTKKEYDEMIARLENDMRINGGRYKPNEELRVLSEIKSMKHGIQLLNDMDVKKKVHLDLSEQFKLKKQERANNWANYNTLNDKKAILNENNHLLKDNIAQIESDIDRCKTQKNEIKKQFKKEQQEYIAYIKELQAVKSTERAQHDSQLKVTNEIYNLQNVIRDCTKLITYLQNFQKTTPTDLSQQTDLTSTSPSSSCSSDVLISNALFKKPNSLNINDSSLSSSTINTPTNDCANMLTPTNPTGHSFEENGGLYILKKKTLDELCDSVHNKKGWKRGSKTRNKFKPIKIPYTPEELCLFENLQVKEPTCSTHIDDCIKILREKRDKTNEQLKICEQQNLLIESLNDLLDNVKLENEETEDDIDIDNTNITLIKTTLDCLETYLGFDERTNNSSSAACGIGGEIEKLDKQSSIIFSDTNSEISYLDLNYESDCSNIQRNKITNTKQRQQRYTSSSSKDNNSNTISDDSDVTLPDTTQTKDKPTGLSIQPVLSSASKSEMPIMNTPPLIMHRQLSDGYSSSNQLSAGSNIGGQNPFFNDAQQ